MGGSYKQCIHCGKRALVIATRCPGCGREFLAPAVPEGDLARGLGRFLSPRVAAGILAAAAVLAAATLGRTSRPPGERSSIFGAGAIAADSIAAASEVAYAIAVTTLLDPATSAELPEESAGQLLVARTWASVRKSRSRSASLEAVLMPGDTVFADFLERGWYRVALEGEVLGYAHRSTLAATGARTEQSVVKESRPGS